MLHKTDSNAILFVGAALGLFFIGGLLTTVAPPLIDKSWNKPSKTPIPPRDQPASLLPTPTSRCAATRFTSAKDASTATRNRPALWLLT